MRRAIVKRFIKWFLLLLLLLGFILLAVLLLLARPMELSTESINVLSPKFLIAHAGGAIDGQIYTNSKEAVMNSLDNGFRYIELDLYKTQEGDVVCSHDSSTYKFKPIMTLREAVEVWQERQFEYVIDKISDPQILNQYFKSNRVHVYVETFSVGEYIQLKRDGYVPMLSVGGIRGLLKYVVTSMHNGKVDWIVTHYQTPEYILRIYKRLGSKIAVYTVNDISYLKKHIGKDVDMVYTDNIIPSND